MFFNSARAFVIGPVAVAGTLPLTQVSNNTHSKPNSVHKSVPQKAFLSHNSASSSHGITTLSRLSACSCVMFLIIHTWSNSSPCLQNCCIQFSINPQNFFPFP